MGNKDKGAAAERKVQHLLESAGYYVMKSGGSFGAFDLIAVSPTCMRLIQVKYGTARLTPAEREEIQHIKVPSQCSKEYWLVKKGEPDNPIIEFID